MSRFILEEEEAKHDAREAAEYYLRKVDLGLAHRFLNALNDMYDMLADYPGIGSLWEPDEPQYANIRRKSVPGFPKFQIFYQATDDTLRILHVFHSSRNISSLF